MSTLSPTADGKHRRVGISSSLGRQRRPDRDVGGLDIAILLLALTSVVRGVSRKCRMIARYSSLNGRRAASAPAALAAGRWVAAVEWSAWRNCGTRLSWNSARCRPLRIAAMDSERHTDAQCSTKTPM